MDSIKKILKEETNKRDILKERIKQQFTAGGHFNLGKVVKTFGGNNPVIEEAVLDWAEECIQRMKNITPKPEAEETFIKMFDGLYADTYFEKYPNSIFFFKGNPSSPDCWFELVGEWFDSNYDKVWSIFSMEYSMEFDDIQNLIRYMVEEAFRLKGVTPSNALLLSLWRWKKLSNQRTDEPHKKNIKGGD